MLLALFVVACSAGTDHDGFEESELSEIADSIINGTDWPNGFGAADGRYVTVSTAAGLCSGTLLRGHVVLTAKHCIHSQGWVNQTSGFVPPASITVTSQTGAQSAAVTSYQVRNNPNWEVALLRLASALPFGASALPGGEGFTQVAGCATRDDLLNQQLWCAGWGINAGTLVQCLSGFTGTGGGTLRGHWNAGTFSGSGAGSPTFSSHARLTFNANVGDQNRSSGDSGSSCARQNGAGNLWETVDVLGWYTDGATCANYGGQWAVSGVDGLASAGFALWLRPFLGQWTTNTFDPFSTNTLSAYTIVDPVSPSGGAGSWQWTGSNLRQSNNSHQWLGDVMDGTKLILRQRPMADAIVSARISSTDNDAAGVIFHFQDATHYYQVTVDEERSRVQFAKRNGNTYTHVKSQPISLDWAAGHVVKIRARSAEGFNIYVDDQWIMNAGGGDTSCDYRDGYAGVILAGMQPATVDDFTITNLTQ